MCADAPRWKDAGHDRDAIRRAGDVAIREARPADSSRVQSSAQIVEPDTPGAASDVHAKGRDVFAVDDRKSGWGRSKCVAIVGRVQLAAEMDVPAAFAPERQKQSGRAFGDDEIFRRAQMR